MASERNVGRPEGSRNTAIVHDEPIFEQPPVTAIARKSRGSNWERVAETLKKNPRQYARVSTHQNEESAKAAASGIRNGKRAGFEPSGSFEAKFGEATEGDFGVWAQYVGAGDIGAADDLSEVADQQEPMDAVVQ